MNMRVLICAINHGVSKKGGNGHSYFPECVAMAAKDGSIIPVGQ